MKKGFTLIELLAVIVILAIIALIATPIVLNIINETKESAIKRSAEFYIDAVENSMATAMLHNVYLESNKTYKISSEGDICINDDCSKTLTVEVEGEKPNYGTITLNDGVITIFSLNINGYNAFREIGEDDIIIAEAPKSTELAPGLYDENDELIVSWEELVEKHSFKDLIVQGGLDDNVPSYGKAAYIIIKQYSAAKKLIIDPSVTTIGNYAFQGCTNLTTIEIYNQLKSVGNKAFQGCTNLKNISVYDIDRLGDYAFQNCSSLTKIPRVYGYIGDYAFESCTSLKNVTLNTGVQHMGVGVFRGCTGLTEIELPRSLNKIEDYTFQGCTNLTTIEIADNINIIGSGAFSGCIGLKNITISNSVYSIGSGAFNGCSSLTSIVIPNSVGSIGSGAFSGCTNLTNIMNNGSASGAPWGAPNATVH